MPSVTLNDAQVIDAQITELYTRIESLEKCSKFSGAVSVSTPAENPYQITPDQADFETIKAQWLSDWRTQLDGLYTDLASAASCTAYDQCDQVTGIYLAESESEVYTGIRIGWTASVLSLPIDSPAIYVKVYRQALPVASVETPSRNKALLIAEVEDGNLSYIDVEADNTTDYVYHYWLVRKNAYLKDSDESGPVSSDETFDLVYITFTDPIAEVDFDAITSLTADTGATGNATEGNYATRTVGIDTPSGDWAGAATVNDGSDTYAVTVEFRTTTFIFP